MSRIDLSITRITASFINDLKKASLAIVLSMLVGSQAVAATCEAVEAKSIANIMASSTVKAGLKSYVEQTLKKGLVATPGCMSVDGGTPMYPGVAVKDCTYRDKNGLDGWVLMAVIPSDTMTRWIYNSCDFAADRGKCVRSVAVWAKCSNTYTFPIVGNMIEPSSSGGGKTTKAANFIFLHGITIARPNGIPEFTSVSPDEQRKILMPLVRAPDAYRQAPAQIARPAGIRRETYKKYVKSFVDAAGRKLDVGATCPLNARRAEWLDVARLSLLEGLNGQRHRLIDALARALDAGDSPGKVKC